MRFLMAVVLLTLLGLFPVRGESQTSAGDPSQVASTANGTPRTVTSQATLQTRSATPIAPDYRIGAGDLLRVSVFEEPQFTTSAMVRPDGKISIPLISDLPVAGLTPEDAQRVLVNQLSRFVRRPRVTVIVEEIHSRVVYVTGEVQHPGAYPLLNPMNVVQLIARAGGTTESAKKKEVYVLHQDGGARVKVNYQMLLAGKHEEENLGLSPGDTVVVP